MLRNKTAIECWNILKYEIESIVHNLFHLKNKENGLERNISERSYSKNSLQVNHVDVLYEYQEGRRLHKLQTCP